MSLETLASISAAMTRMGDVSCEPERCVTYKPSFKMEMPISVNIDIPIIKPSSIQRSMSVPIA